MLAVLLSSTCTSAKDGPRIYKTQFDTPPTNLQYFDDSDIILVQERDRGIVWRSEDAGKSWKQIEDIDEKEASEVWLHPYNNQIAYTIGTKNQHWVTEDQGTTWTSFKTRHRPDQVSAPLGFHAGDSRKVLIQGEECRGWDCEVSTYYTTDNFKNIKLLRDDTRLCHFAHSTPRFQTSKDDKDDDRILCVVKGKFSSRRKDYRLLVSDDYFVNDEYEPALDGDRTVQGIISTAVVKGFIVAAAKAEGTDELALYVTVDADTWHRAEFPNNHKVKEEAYTILESTNYSIQVDVMTTRPGSAMGVLFSSNSNGTYFTENIQHTNRNYLGHVDFEKIQNIQGIILVNVVDNWKEVEQRNAERKVKTQISFDDGRTFQPITDGKNNFHLHSVTDMSNVGRVFSSAAPGLVMGVGNTGDYLKKYEEGDLYVSDDAGLTWWKALNGAHKYEFGDQGSVLLAVDDEGPTNKISYSINHGKKWESAKLDEKVKARILTTTPDSTSLKFVLLGTVGSGSGTEYYIFSIDFEGLHERKCGTKDYEDWWARLDKNGEPDCLMGRKQQYRRRKADADCFIDEKFKDPEPEWTPCPCSDEDFECDFNFVRGEDGKDCIPAGPLPVPEDQCQKAEDEFKGPSGYRLIPGNQCDAKKGVNLEKEVPRPCKETEHKPVSGKVSHEATAFKASGFRDYYYLERTSTSEGTDETVIMLTDRYEVYISQDHGKTWREILKDEEIVAIAPHRYFHDVFYFFTGTKKVFYSVNRGDMLDSFEAEAGPNVDSVDALVFHPDYKDYLIWTGAQGCEKSGSKECHSVAYITKDRGSKWDILLRYVRRCEFIKKEGRGDKENLVYCEQHKDEKLDGPWQLLSSDNWFADSKTHFEDITAFATMSEFIIVAAKDSKSDLKLDASVDGTTFADAQFPKNFNVPHQQAYTVLDSSTHAVFVNVMVGTNEGFEYGTIIKSNSNGTSYVLSINGVNRNTAGYVDFEKMLGLEGVAVVNVVENLEDGDKRRPKKLRTLITHNDGAQWDQLQAPSKDVDGKDFECKANDGKRCSLHLHGYTERADPRNTFSSPSAIGLMIGVGNVGEFLTPKAEADTFMTSDGGITWTAVKKGSHMWEFGDRGSIIVLVAENVATDEVFYSLDEGKSWQSYKFSNSKMKIDAITTLPSDNSRNFLLWSTDSSNGKEILTVNIDFSGLTDKECELDEDNPKGGDYYLWSPKHPMQEDDCLFGHVSQYHRKKLDSQCYNGRKFESLHNIAKTCSCTRQDFEW